jgi:hypothetical protein
MPAARVQQSAAISDGIAPAGLQAEDLWRGFASMRILARVTEAILRSMRAKPAVPPSKQIDGTILNDPINDQM